METGISSWAMPAPCWWVPIRPVLQLSSGHCSWKVSLETHFPPLLHSEVYMFHKCLQLNRPSVAGTPVPQGPQQAKKPVVLYCCSPRVLQEGPWRTLMKAVSFPLQSCPTLCDPIDGSPPGSAIPGILQARTLEQVATSFSNAWKWKMKMKSLSRVRLFATPWTADYQAAPSMGFSGQEYWSGVPLPSPWRFPLPLVKDKLYFYFLKKLNTSTSDLWT